MDSYTIRFNIGVNDKTRGELFLIFEGQVIDIENVRILPNLDSMLIKTLDKILQRNRIKGLSIKSMEIGGNLEENSLSSSVIKAIKSALDY